MTVIAFVNAPFVQVTPGPTPQLSPLIAAANPDGTPDRAFPGAGQWLVTTINATRMTWGQTAWCAVRSSCELHALASSPGAQASADQAMRRSQEAAADLAGTWAPHATWNPTADLADIGGPSAGLMLTLAFLDAATDGDLTGGHVIAGTGTINTLAEVGPVVGVNHKVAGAAAAGADVFFTPTARTTEAVTAAAGTGLTVIPVAYLTDALAWLCDHGATSSVCQSPALK